MVAVFWLLPGLCAYNSRNAAQSRDEKGKEQRGEIQNSEDAGRAVRSQESSDSGSRHNAEEPHQKAETRARGALLSRGLTKGGSAPW